MSFLKGFKEVFSKPFYILVALSGMLLFYLLEVIISDFSDLRIIANGPGSFDSLRLLFSYFIGYPSTLDHYAVFSILFLSILFGSYLTMAIYKTGQVNKMGSSRSFLGYFGVFFGILTPGCAACGLGLASLLGIGGALVALPFDGREISMIAFVLLGYANFSIAKKINQNTCSIRIK